MSTHEAIFLVDKAIELAQRKVKILRRLKCLLRERRKRESAIYEREGVTSC